MSTRRISKMFVITRSGRQEPVSFDKILSRLEALAVPLAEYLADHGIKVADQEIARDPEVYQALQIDPFEVAKETISGLKNGIETSELDNLSEQICSTRSHIHPDYDIYATRIAVSNLHKQVNVSNYGQLVANMVAHGALIPSFGQFVATYADRLQNLLQFQRDYQHNYFGWNTRLGSSLIKLNRKVAETPQHCFMRVAIAIHALTAANLSSPSWPQVSTQTLERIEETYNLMSMRYFTHASPTLFNAGTPISQFSSCFLLECKDSMNEIYDEFMASIARFSKTGGGIGGGISRVRAKGTPISTTPGGKSDGVVPLIKVIEATVRYVNQSGKRKGSAALYLEPWHADVMDFLGLRLPNGDERLRARDIFTAMWVPDLFMRRVRDGGMWSLMCPHQCPGLVDTYGEEFDQLYQSYEKKGQYHSQLPAIDVWNAIMRSQFESGTPYVMFKDAVNRKNPQANLGTIQCSNLCSEITEFTGKDSLGGYNQAVCNLASINVERFYDRKTDTYDHVKLSEVARVITRNLNNIIDCNYYATEAAKYSNLTHRPIGIGRQGYADLLQSAGIPIDRDTRFNRLVSEAIYYGSTAESALLAAEHGHYLSYPGSPAALGRLAFDDWGLIEADLAHDADGQLLFDWGLLRSVVSTHGLRNSLRTTQPPTASTSQMLGNTESNEMPFKNIGVRKVLSGEYVVVQSRLVRSLIERGLWNQRMYQHLILSEGSVQSVPGIPTDLRELYKTAFEVKQSVIIARARERAPFLDQSESLNLNFLVSDNQKLTSCLFRGWELGLKTGSYYVRTRAAEEPIKFGLSPELIASLRAEIAEGMVYKPLADQPVIISDPSTVCRRDDPSCESCSA